MDNKKILITGGAGAIGSNLVRRLNKNNQVTILDDLSSGYMSNIFFNTNVNFIRGDITSDSKLEEAFESGIDIVFHLAACFANQNSVDHPRLDLMTNGLGTLKLLEKAVTYGIEKFVYASSSCTVGETPNTPYAMTKFLGQQYTHFFHTIHNLPTVTVRFYNSYGPGEVPGKYRNVVPNFISKALKGEPLTITGTGYETRDFTYIDDIVTATILAAESNKAVGKSIDIGTGKETKILDLTEKIIKLTNSKSEIIFGSRRGWDTVTGRYSPTEKTEELIGFVPATTLDEGLPTTINWIKQLSCQ